MGSWRRSFGVLREGGGLWVYELQGNCIEGRRCIAEKFYSSFACVDGSWLSIISSVASRGDNV